MDVAVVLIEDVGRDGRPVPKFLLRCAVGLLAVVGGVVGGRVLTVSYNGG